jgi:tetratricopeptide (TPR) repeat protein
MKYLRLSYTIALLLPIACATVTSQTDFLSGRRALLVGEPDNALSYFVRVAQSNPEFVTSSVSPRRSIWTYIARAHYNSGRYAEAKSAAEKALSYVSDDYIGRLYLGLTLLRPAPARVPVNPFTLQDVTFALRESVAPKRIAALARERGILFDLNQETETQLRNVGADNFLLSELKNIRAENGNQIQASDNQGNQANKELTTALNDLRDWLNHTIAYSLQGRFWDPGQEIRNQIDRSLKQLASASTNRDALISGAEWIGYQIEEENDRARRDEAAERQRLR